MTDDEVIELYKKIQEFFNNRIPNPEHYPRIFEHYLKLYKMYNS